MMSSVGKAGQGVGAEHHCTHPRRLALAQVSTPGSHKAGAATVSPPQEWKTNSARDITCPKGQTGGVLPLDVRALGWAWARPGGHLQIDTRRGLTEGKDITGDSRA